ncbi:sulfatase-like hydrolase/transferase [Paenibacillus sp. CC-CFT747]|nr:sulfatase-like hydrolase/transferase [Paenibacillus sp. CC-CFT747]
MTQPSEAGSVSRPNILIFMTDQQQAQVVQPGHPCRLPHLRRLAAEGLSFSRVYPPMAHCSPARASFMTGLYPSQHGIHNNVSNEQAIGRSLTPGTETFSEKLKDAGYGLFFTGKWHVSATENPGTADGRSSVSKPGRTFTWASAGRRGRRLRPPCVRKRGAGGIGEIVRPGWGNVQLYGTSPLAYEQTEDYQVVRRGIEQLEKLQGATAPGACTSARRVRTIRSSCRNRTPACTIRSRLRSRRIITIR